MITLIILFSVIFAFFTRDWKPRFLWSFLFSVNFAFWTGDVWTLWQNRHDSIDYFFAVNLAALDGAIPKLHVKNLPEKNCRWEGAIPMLQVKKFAGEKVQKFAGEKVPSQTAGGGKAPSQNCRRSMQFGLGPLECQCVTSSGAVFGALWFCPAPEHFYRRNPSLPRGWGPTIRQYGRGCHGSKNSSYLFGGVVWWPPTNSRWTEE